MKQIIFLFLLGTILQPLLAQQTVGSWKDEKALYAETKQVNQFFRRFNNEEAVDGTRLYNKKDSAFRDLKTRPKYLKMIFDNENPSISKEIKNTFITDITNKSKPQYLDFHGGKWFAEVKTTFNYYGKEEPLIIFLTIQDARVGSKWVISGITFKPYARKNNKDTTDSKYFLHPLSHEVDFMNIHKIFEHNVSNIFEYTAQDFQVDQTTLFLEDVSKNHLKFVSVNNVKLHFFQIDGWYFELSEFNRTGNNNGWLISSITKANDKEKVKLEKYIKSRNDQ